MSNDDLENNQDQDQDKNKNSQKKEIYINEFFRSICRECGTPVNFTVPIPKDVKLDPKKLKKFQKIVKCPRCSWAFKVKFDKDGNVILK